MKRREQVETAGVVLLVTGAAILSPAWSLIVLGTLILVASVVGRLLECYRQ